MRRLIIDADTLLYLSAHAATVEDEWSDHEITIRLDLEQARQHLIAEVESLVTRLGADSFLFCLSDPAQNWRLGVLPTYKHNRTGKKPVGFKQLVKFAEEHFGPSFLREPTLEADDLVGIHATAPGSDDVLIVVSEDKDLLQVPGLLYNPRHPDDGLRMTDEFAADRRHMIQTLTGDRVDGYDGIPGVGPVKAEKILDGLRPEDWWGAVVDAYERAGLTEEAALGQARVARVLRHGEYDWKTKKVRLWTPDR